MSNDGEFTMELFGIDENPEEESPEVDETEISEEELESRLQTATEEEINAYNDDGIIPPLRESANANLPTEPEAEKPAKKERKKRQPKQEVADDAFRLPGGRGLRAELQKAGLTEVDAIGEIQSNQIADTEGYVAIRTWQAWALGHGFSISFLQKLVGGNRALTPPLHPLFRTVWFGKRKYFKNEVMSEDALKIMTKIRDEQQAQPKEVKPKKERKAKADAIPQEVAPPQETLADLSKATLVNWLKNAVPDANVNKNMSKAQLLTIVEENGLTMKDYFAQS